MRISRRALLALAIALVMVSASAALAGHTGGPFVLANFEIDGNTADDPGTGLDWDTLPVVVSFDDASGPTDDTFGDGSKEFVPDQWLFETASVPQKGDILQGGVAVFTHNADVWLATRFTRLGTTGDTFINFEFNRSGATFVNSKGSTVPVRTTGDRLIGFSVTNGGKVITINVVEWQGNALSGVWQAPVIDPIPVRGTDWDATTNLTSGNTFGEAVLRLAAFNLPPSCPGTGRAWIKSIASQQIATAALLDRTVQKEVDISTCATKSWTFTFDPQPIAGLQVFAVYTVEGSETRTLELLDGDLNGSFTGSDDKVPPGTVSFHFEVRNGNALVWSGGAGTETFATKETRTNAASLAYGITLTPENAENFADTPHVLTAHVFEVGTIAPLPNVPVNFSSSCGSLSALGGLTDASGLLQTTLTSSDPCTASISAWINGTAAGATSAFDTGEASDTATKAFVRYALTVTPPSAVNEAGQPHLFLVLLTKDSGSGPAGLGGQTLHLSLSAGGTDAQFTAVNGSSASGTEADCTTLGDGTCTATIVASQAGEIGLVASYLATVGSETRTIESTGTKHYVDASIAITPAAAVNEAGTSHAFTITVTAFPDGTGAPSFDSIAASVSPAPDSATDDCSTPTVSGNTATCTLTISNGSAGTFTANATASLTMGGLVVTRSTAGNAGPGGSGPGVKQYVDAAIAITPGGAQVNEVGDAHVFTVTVTAFPAGTGAPSFGAISTTVSPPTDSATTCGSPVIVANVATCTVTINSSVAGTFTVNASASVTMGGVIVTRATDGNSGPGGSGPGVKHFVDAAIGITPSAAANEVGKPHAFTITVTAFPGGTGPVSFGPITLSVSPTPDSATDDCSAPTVSGDTATCTLTISNASAGTFTVNASAEVTIGGVTVSRSTGGNSGPGGTGAAVKHYVDASIGITPGAAVNEVGVPHVFTIAVNAFPGGAGPVSFGPITVSVSPTPDSATDDCASPTVSGDTATCTLTINSSSPVTFTVQATADVTIGGVTVSRATNGNSGPGGTGGGTKVYVRGTLVKAACPTVSSPRGGLVDYQISFKVEGAALHGASVIDALPAQIHLLSAADIAGVTPSIGAGAVSWSFPTLPPGDYSGAIHARVKPDAALGSTAQNVVTFDADEIAAKTATHDLLVTSAGSATSGRAYGVRADVLGGGLLIGDPDVPPTPDSDATNPGEVASVPDPLGGPTPLVRILRVSETDTSTDDSAGTDAIATASAVNIDLYGVHVQASSVVAASSSAATISTAGSSRSGSIVQDLAVNGVRHGNLTEPTTITVKDPLSGAVLAEVRVLETTSSGAAGGDPQPATDGKFRSGTAVNGIHVIVHDVTATPVDESSDIIVAHAESSAAFTSGLGCQGSVPAVLGSAYALDVANVIPDPGASRVAQVNLPITGGSDSATILHIDLPVGTSGSAFTSTDGEITDGDGDGLPVEAHARATIEGLDLLGGTITATKVQARSDSTPGGSSGGTTIADLVIAGNDVCALLGLTSTCEPPPDTVLLLPGTATIVVLNEQVPLSGGLTVNAVHIYVLGKTNPFGLPAGAEIIISSATSGTSA